MRKNRNIQNKKNIVTKELLTSIVDDVNSDIAIAVNNSINNEQNIEKDVANEVDISFVDTSFEQVEVSTTEILTSELIGSIDSCDENGISGWVLNKHGLGGWQVVKPNEPDIDIFVDDELITRVNANLFRQDLANALIGDGCCAFYVEMPERFFDGVEHNIEIRESNNGSKIESTLSSFCIAKVERFNIEQEKSIEEVELSTTEILASELIGNIDACDENGISGWVLDKRGLCGWQLIDKPIEPDIDIFIDDELIARVTANLFRQDLADALIGDGHCAFYIDMPERFFDGVEHKIEVWNITTDKLLSGCDKTFTLQKVTKSSYDWPIDNNTCNELTDVVTGSNRVLLPEKDKKNSLFINDYKNYSVEKRNCLIKKILTSGLFNHVLYTQQTGVVFGIVEAIDHFLTIGADQNLNPMLGFNSQEYRLLNPDIPEQLSNAKCFVHYVLIGQKEKRYFSKAMLMHDAATFRTYPDFDTIWYSFCAKDISDNWDAHEHYLAIGWRKKISPNRNSSFDSEVYLKYYFDARQSNMPPYLHYLSKGKNRLSCMIEVNHELINPILQSGEFDTNFYQTQCNETNISDLASAVAHYVFTGTELNLNPNEIFDTEYYLRRYPDIAKNILSPFIHYFRYGRNEGRIAGFTSEHYIRSGHSAFNSNKPTIVVVCHEASRTGAPILGLQLIEQLSYRANIICWLGKGGVLLDNFVDLSVAVVNNPSHHVDAIWIIRELQKRYSLQVAILNSVATSDISAGFYEEKVPILALVHEYSDYMSQNVAQILFAANRIVFPAEGVKATADVTSTKSFGVVGTHSVVQHQGRCVPPAGDDGKIYARQEILLKMGISEDDEIPAVVLGCGWVQIRKGVEYFVEAAKYCKELINKPIRFVWVGAGYAPDTDLNYSVWLKSQIINSNLENDIIFFEETNDLTPFFELADVFFMSSRLDPFPNVALDAVDAGVPVIAFERATGFAEFIHKYPTVGAVAPFLDTGTAAKLICDYVTNKKTRPENSIEIAEKLLFSTYADFIWEQCQIAIEQQKQIDKESQLIMYSKQFDSDFYTSATPNWQSILPAEYIYVATWVRGIATAKSRVGFNDKVAQTIISNEIVKNSTMTPLARMLTTHAATLTHQTIYIDPNERIENKHRNLSVALHIHAHYTETLHLLLKRFSTLGQSITFCITTNTDDKAKIILAMAKKVSSKINVVVVPNRGRDVGPFIMAMKEHLSDFDIVGHFHLKGTKQLEQTVVRQWQDFLYDTLIGKEGEIANTLLYKLEQNSKLGLLFQEDPCLPSWSKNRELAEKLLKDLEIDRQTPENIEYPTGNMFWVKTAALAPLLKHDWQWKDFPAEPVPYDGSILHAIERLTPIICEEAGYEWATVHNPNAKRYYS